jgi:hypothetical protein
MKGGHCIAGAAVNAIWIEALEFVLGDDAHRLRYDELIQAIAAPLDDEPNAAGREILLEHSLRMALLRLR